MTVDEKDMRQLATLGWYRGVGRSQRPLIREGDWVETESVASRDLRPGDLAVFCAKQHLVCHRVVWRKQDRNVTWFYFKGDAEIFGDGWIPDYRVLGRVKAISGKSTDSFRFRARSTTLLVYSLARTLLFRFAFLRPWGPPLGRLRRSLSRRRLPC